jgi:hypothetical protein
MRRIAAALVLLSGLIGNMAGAAEAVDLELVLLADASRSIDDAEIRFQRLGYVVALTHPEILSAITSGIHRRIAITYVEWGDTESQEVVVPWSIVDGRDSAAAFARKLLDAPRIANGPNAIGNAIAAAHALIEANGIAGTRRVIDFSGDSAYTWGGIGIAEARAHALAAGITINGLAVLCRAAECSGRPVAYDLERAFADLIIGGPGAFVVTADGNASFAEAVRRKLLLEIAGLVSSGGGAQGPSSARTISAPATMASSLRRASQRGMAEKPQSAVMKSFSAGTTSRTRRIRSATSAPDSS